MERTDQRIDLNLFRVLDAIYTQGGVSAAARVLHLTQPAVTHALKRLRDHLGDPLFVRQGNRLLPTERVRAMMPAIQAHLEGLHASAHAQPRFDALRLELTFSVGFRDILESIALPALLAQLEREAPHVRVLSRRIAADEVDRELRAGTLDLVVDRPLRAGPQIVREHLADETLVVVMRAGHVLSKALKRHEYLSAAHVTVSPLGEASALDVLLGQSGTFRQVRLTCQHYFSACQMVAGTDLLLTVPRSYAIHLAALLPIAVLPLPIKLKTVPIMAYWHASTQEDPAHTWFRRHVAEAIKAGVAH
ncbi:LysR family transcriptional regulator [Dyella jejuensis]|uniref:LysR family transcriptional regulator n=1 Tax=Dyella jejuensis TaxID=1432009 RepID=A0ABW8JJ43_9GAMM